MAYLAINGGKKLRKKPFPSWPVHDEREVRAVAKVVRSGNWSYLGPLELEFAEKFAKFQDATYGTCVNGGTSGIEVALKATGVVAGDEVIVPAMTFYATAAPVLFCNAVPVFVDVDPETYCIDPAEVEKAITQKTKAIVPVHLGNRMADMDRLMEIAEKHDLVVVEDCAHSHGMRWRNRGAGSIGHAGVFSFQQSKTMTCGEGGIVITSSPEVNELCHAYVNSGRFDPKFAADPKKKPQRVLGYNYRITEFQAAILLVQLGRLEGQIEKRESNSAYLNRKLEKVGLRPLKRDRRLTRENGYFYSFKYDPAPFGGAEMKLFVDAMNAEGIPTGNIGFQPLYQDEMMAFDPRYFNVPYDYSKVRCPVAERAALECFSFSHSMFLGTRKDMDDIASAAAKIAENSGELQKLQVPSR
ncbi:MAG: DegT/DnrJ/EryC1/StrS family aminotransferase [Thermoproteota archaeon]